MNILFITLLDLEDLSKTGIYEDFVNELKNQGHQVTVASAREKRNSPVTGIIRNNGINILKVSIGDVTKTNSLKKGINTLLLERYFYKAINRYLKNRKFDLIISTTPPITLNNLIRKLKIKYKAKTYLLLKDIFPQNAVDLEMISKKSLIYKVFRKKEQKLYEISDYIGAMSQYNLDFINKHNKISSKTQIIRNAVYEQDYTMDYKDKMELITKYNIDPSRKLLLYGGNLGKPQSPDYIVEVLKKFNEIKDAQIFIVGNGTHYSYIKDEADKLKNKYIHVLSSLPKEEFDQLVSLSDIGLIFLDYRFTIPNYPSRLTSLLNAAKPILIATDKNTDIGKEVVESGSGLWNESNDVDAFIQNANKLIKSDELHIYGANAYKFFNKEFRIEDNVRKLLNFINSPEESKV